MKRLLQIALPALISGLAVWYSLAGVELGRVFTELEETRPLWLIPVALCAALTLWIRALRWRLLLATLGPLRNTPVFDATCIGFMGNMIFPLRAGEAIKPLVVARGGEIGAAAALATVAVERICDLVALGGCLLVAVVLVPQGAFLRDRLGLLVAAVTVVAIGGVLAVRWREGLEGWVVRLARVLPEGVAGAVKDGVHGLLGSLAGLAAPRVLAGVVATSAAVWGVTAAGFAFSAQALGIDAPAAALGIVVTVVVAIAVAVPSAPGYVGVFWAGSEIALELFGVPRSLGFGYGLLNWAVQMIVIVGLGLWSVVRLDLSLGALWSAARGGPGTGQARS